MGKDEARCVFALAYAIGVMDGLLEVTNGKIDYNLDNLPCRPRDNRTKLWKWGKTLGREAITQAVDNLMLGDQDADT